MKIKSIRKIVRIDEDKCNGCGVCIPSCAEGAIKIIDGKAKLVSDKYCDGLGACLGNCPKGAINIEERSAEEFDEEAAKLHHEATNNKNGKLPGVYSAAMITLLETADTDNKAPKKAAKQDSRLSHWPVKLALVSPAAPFLQGIDVVIAADCIPFTYADFHQDFLKNHSLLVACPKLDDFQAHLDKLTNIFKQSTIKSLKVVRMEVPCCSGLTYMVKQALQRAQKDIPLKEVTISIKGEIKT
jgi:Pyruvate/2-oxoacid:ferredoxin oxidoreductase delta subunit